MSTNKRMGDAHEGFLAALFEGIQNRGSGNQWRNPIDGRQSRKHKRFAFAWDGKSTLAKSISIPLTMWEKAREQAGGDRPMLGLRWYANEKLDVVEDLVVIGAHDFAEVLEAAENPAPAEMLIEIAAHETFTARRDLTPTVTVSQIRVNGVSLGLSDISVEIFSHHTKGTQVLINGKRCLLPTNVVINDEKAYYDEGLLAEMGR